MATTKSSLWATLRYAIKLIHNLFLNASVNSGNFLTDYRTLQQNYGGNNTATIEATLAATRTSINNIINQTQILSSIILELARVGYNGQSSTVASALQEIRDGMAANSETVKERGTVFGSIVAGASNIGNGQFFRLTYDKNGFLIESGQYQSGKIHCTVNLDSYTGRQEVGQEKAILKGNGVVGVDSLERGAVPSGVVTLTAMRNEDCLLLNAQLSYTDNGTTISITNWIIANDAKTTAITMVDDELRENSNAVVFTANNSISQSITEIAQIDPTLPFFAIAQIVKTTAGSDGLCILTLGSKTEQIDISTLTLNQSYFLTIGIEDEKGWYDNWKDNEAEFKIELSGRTSGDIKIQNLILAQPTQYNGIYFMLVSSSTPLVSGDTFEMTDSSSNTGAIQTTLARLFGQHLPHTAGTPTYADA